MNRILDDVGAAFDRVAIQPHSIAIDPKGGVLPAGSHAGIPQVGDSQRLATQRDGDSFNRCEGDDSMDLVLAQISSYERSICKAAGPGRGFTQRVAALQATTPLSGH